MQIPATKPMGHVKDPLSSHARQAESRRNEIADDRPISRNERLIRILNVLAAVIGLIITLPLWLVIAVAVKVTSRGPVFYTQTRVGLDQRGVRPTRSDSRRRADIGGKPFTILKFRTMTADAEHHGNAVWAQEDDQRVTALGGFLRSCRLDELPQLLNVIRGDMNLVGPRPERPQLFTELRQQIPDYQKRQRVPPGITGHAQVHLQYDTSVEDVKRKVEHDMEYIARRSVWEDLKIMLKTIPVMLFRKGGW
jgi:lipopolysaccharide/colanic/teichoic acid biosynthesis glycosyltransferase